MKKEKVFKAWIVAIAVVMIIAILDLVTGILGGVLGTCLGLPLLYCIELAFEENPARVALWISFVILFVGVIFMFVFAGAKKKGNYNKAFALITSICLIFVTTEFVTGLVAGLVANGFKSLIINIIGTALMAVLTIVVCKKSLKKPE